VHVVANDSLTPYCLWKILSTACRNNLGQDILRDEVWWEREFDCWDNSLLTFNIEEILEMKMETEVSQRLFSPAGCLPQVTCLSFARCWKGRASGIPIGQRGRHSQRGSIWGDERNGQGEVESVLDRTKRVRVRTGHYKGRQSPYWAGQVEAESVLGRTSRGRVRTGQDKEIQSPY